MITTWTLQYIVSNSFLAQESSVLDLILQEDGGAIILTAGTEWTLKTAN